MFVFQVMGTALETSAALGRRARELGAAADRLFAANRKAQGLLTAAHQR